MLKISTIKCVGIGVFLMFCSVVFAQKKVKSNKMNVIQPVFLQKGDTVAIVAPAGTLQGKEEIIEKGISLLKSWGLYVEKGAHLFDNYYHFSATDKHRISDFQEALDNPKVKAIWCARGGYGTTRIIDEINFDQFIKNPKWIIGYSDITVLHNQIHNLGVQTLHAMMPIDFKHPADEIELSVKTLKKAIFGESLTYKIPSSKYNQKGTVSGKLVGGNLTLLQNVLESKSSIDTKNKILFIEEIGEYKYHIDRMLCSLKRAGYFENCNGIIVGGMTKIKKNSPAFGQAIEELILQVIDNSKIPILFDFPAGHDVLNKALFFGKKATLSVKNEESSLMFH